MTQENDEDYTKGAAKKFLTDVLYDWQHYTEDNAQATKNYIQALAKDDGVGIADLSKIEIELSDGSKYSYFKLADALGLNNLKSQIALAQAQDWLDRAAENGIESEELRGEYKTYIQEWAKSSEKTKFAKLKPNPGIENPKFDSFAKIANNLGEIGLALELAVAATPPTPPVRGSSLPKEDRQRRATSVSSVGSSAPVQELDAQLTVKILTTESKTKTRKTPPLQSKEGVGARTEPLSGPPIKPSTPPPEVTEEMIHAQKMLNYDRTLDGREGMARSVTERRGIMKNIPEEYRQAAINQLGDHPYKGDWVQANTSLAKENAQAKTTYLQNEGASVGHQQPVHDNVPDNRVNTGKTDDREKGDGNNKRASISSAHIIANGLLENGFLPGGDSSSVSKKTTKTRAADALDQLKTTLQNTNLKDSKIKKAIRAAYDDGASVAGVSIAVVGIKNNQFRQKCMAQMLKVNDKNSKKESQKRQKNKQQRTKSKIKTSRSM